MGLLFPCPKKNSHELTANAAIVYHDYAESCAGQVLRPIIAPNSIA